MARHVRAGAGWRLTSAEEKNRTRPDVSGAQPEKPAAHRQGWRSEGLTHGVAVQQEEAVGGPSVLQRQVKRVGSVEVHLLLRWQKTAGRRGEEKKERASEQTPPYHGRDVSGPQAQGGPLDVLQEGRAVLGQAVEEGAGQGGGHLQELIGVEERSHGGVQPGESSRGGEHASSWAPGAPQAAETHRTAPLDLLRTTTPNGCLQTSTEYSGSSAFLVAAGTAMGTSKRGLDGSMICSKRSRRRISGTVAAPVLPGPESSLTLT